MWKEDLEQAILVELIGKAVVIIVDVVYSCYSCYLLLVVVVL
jgi:hypothetical protein